LNYYTTELECIQYHRSLQQQQQQQQQYPHSATSSPTSASSSLPPWIIIKFDDLCNSQLLENLITSLVASLDMTISQRGQAVLEEAVQEQAQHKAAHSSLKLEPSPLLKSLGYDQFKITSEFYDYIKYFDL
jgi:hypothetical protein